MYTQTTTAARITRTRIIGNRGTMMYSGTSSALTLVLAICYSCVAGQKIYIAHAYHISQCPEPGLLIVTVAVAVGLAIALGC